jgi:PAS domain S-box-containing protein
MEHIIQEIIENGIQATREPVLILDGDLRVVGASAAFYRAFHLAPERVVSHLLCDLEGGVWYSPHFATLLRQLVATGMPIDEFELQQTLPGDVQRQVAINARQLLQGTPLFLLALENRTSRIPAAVEEKYRQLVVAAQRQTRALHVVNQARALWTSELEVPVIVRLVVEATAEAFGYTQVSVYLIQDNELVLQHQVGYNTVISRVPLSRGVAGRVARTGKAILLKDARSDPDFLAAIEGIVSEICVPLSDEGKTVGVLNVESTNGIVLTEADLELITSLGEHVSSAIMRSRLYTAVRESKDRYQSLVNSLRDVIFQIDAQGLWTFLNPAWTAITGFSLEESIGKHVMDFVHPDDHHIRSEVRSRLFEQRQNNIQMEIRFVTKAGDERWLEVHARLAESPSGKALGLSGTLTDITERRAAEMARQEATAQLAASRDALQRLIQQTPVGIQVFASDGTCTDVNPAHMAIFGIEDRAQLVGKYNIFQDPLAEAAGTADAARRALRGEIVALGDIDFDFSEADPRFVGATGQRTISVTIFPVFNDKAQVANFVGLNVDTTERKRVEEALRHSETAEREQRALAEALRDTAAALTSTLDFEQVMHRILDNVDRVVPHSSANIMLIEGDRARVAYWTGYSSWQIALFQAGLSIPLDSLTLRTMIETASPLLISDVRNYPGWWTSDVDWVGSYAGVPLLAHGQAIGFLNLDSLSPGFFVQAHVERLQAFADQAAVAIENAQLYDAVRRHSLILEQRVAERTADLSAANARLQELDRMKSKFIADASHELRTPVANLSLRLHLLERDLPERRAEHIANLKSQLVRLKELVDHILDFSHLEVTSGERTPLAPINLNALVEQAVDACQPRAEAAGLTLTFLPCADLPFVEGHQSYLIQVATNLIVNAINYTPAGSVTVSTCHETEPERAGLCVKDTGIGIDPEDMPHLFERFYRGKKIGSSNIPGTGLGLSIVREIVEMHGGTVEIDSQIAQGTTVRVWLPLPGSMKEGHESSSRVSR